jgi:outer membrane protein TolC
VPPDLAQRVQQLRLNEVVDLALRNNALTRASWAQARAAANILGSERGSMFPTVDGTVQAGRQQSVVPGRPTSARSQLSPTLNLTYLLFDFGGRSGSIEVARQNLFAAGLSHNAALFDVVLTAQGAYFDYMATKALIAAQQAVVNEATASVTAAEERRGVGLATIADVLQAKTALSEARLALETTQGNLSAARGALAVAMGFPANLPYDVESNPPEIPVRTVSETVDSLIGSAVRNRPDLAAAQAEARAATAQVRVAQSAERPALLLGSSAGRTYSNNTTFTGNTYSLNLGLQIPIFNGFSRGYDVLAARALADAATARAETLRQVVVNQVFISYFALQTATQRVARSNDLLASAEQSETVARARYREGVGNIIDLLTAQAALANARATQVQARWFWNIALAQLAHDTGRMDLGGRTDIKLSNDSIPGR